jgi:HEAT repeat protein
MRIFLLAALLALPVRAEDRDLRPAKVLIEVYNTSKDSNERHKALSTMGNFQTPPLEVLKTLVSALRDPDWFCRASATGSLQRMGAAAASVVPDLIAVASGPDDEFAIHALVCLAKIAPADATVMTAFRQAAAHKNENVRVAAFAGMGDAHLDGSQAALEWLCRMLISAKLDEKVGAAAVIEALGDKALLGLLKIMKEESPVFSELPKGALAAFNRLEDEDRWKAFPELAAALKNGGEWWVRLTAAEALGGLKPADKDQAKALFTVLHKSMVEEPEALVAGQAGEELAAFSPDSLPYLMGSLEPKDMKHRATEKSAWERVRAARALVKVADQASARKTVAALMRVVSDEAECLAVRNVAAESLLEFKSEDGKKLSRAFSARKLRQGERKGCP